MMSQQFLAADVEMFEQDTAGTSVLTEYHISLLQQPYGPECHIFHIAHRGRNKVKHLSAGGD
jgi:hypothetical protein